MFFFKLKKMKMSQIDT